MDATPVGAAEKRKRRGWWIAAPGIVVAATILAVAIFWHFHPHLTDEDVDGAVSTAIEQEAKAAFLVTGHLDITSDARVENTLRFLPGLLDLPLGTTTVSVRAPGRVEYGFDISQMTHDRITLMKGGVIEVKVPQPVVHSVAVNLDGLDIQTRSGWIRAAGDTRDRVQAHALALLQRNMAAQAAQHLVDSKQPDINTADAMFAMLRPVMIAAGMKAPRFRFIIGSNLVMEPRDQ